MDRLKTTLGAICAVFVTILLLAFSLLAINTFVGDKAGNFFDPSSVLGGIAKILSLFFPFLSTFLSFLLGLIFGKYRLPFVYIGAVSVLSITHIFAAFMTQFILVNEAQNAFSRFLDAFFTILAMPARSIAYAFNDAVNLFLTDFAGSRVIVFLATFLTFAAPLLLTIGFLVGHAAQKKESAQKEIEA